MAALAQTPPTAEDELVVPPAFSGPPVVRIWISDLPDTAELSCDGPCIVTVGDLTTLLKSVEPRSIATIRTGPSGIEYCPQGDAPILLNGKPFPGFVRLEPVKGGAAVINHVDLERYLEGVLGAEMPPQWPIEALKAQAVAARTYALYSALSRNGKNWDLMSTVEDQVYSGSAPKPSVVTAVRQTKGEVLLHAGRIFPAFFHSTCGGLTESPSRALGKKNLEFLRGVTCRYCSPSPHYRWRSSISAEGIAQRLHESGNGIGTVREVILTETGPQDQPQVLIAGRDGHKLLTVVDFRRIIGRMDVKSGRFECRKGGDEFVFTGSGLGHGAGMCQWGAKGMAAEGHTYRDILGHYYKSTTLEKLY
jgi:stage II sporulation protein D